MRFFVWAGLFCLSFTWLFTLGIYTVEADIWWVMLLGAGIVCNVAAFANKVVFRSFDRKHCLLCVPLVLSLLILPFPYCMGIIVTLFGIFVLMLCTMFPRLAGVAYGTILSGAILMMQIPVEHLYAVFTSYSHHFYWFDPLLHKIFEFFNLKVSYSQHTFHILSIKDLYPFPTTWEKLGMFPFLNLLVGSIPVFCAFSETRVQVRNFVKLLFSGMVFILFRYVFMILLFLYLMTFVEHGEDIIRMDIFWDVRVTLATFVPLIFVLTLVIPLKKEHAFQAPSTKHQASTWKAMACLSLAFFFLGLAFGFHDPGKQKNGRVILDESHSEWEKSTKKMDTEWYGNESGYNFFWLAEFINHHFPLTRNLEPLTPEILSAGDILIIKTPTRAFSPEEVTSIKDFVENGGGLFLIGEHTNVFGTSTYLNPIAEAFGFSFRYDVILDIERKFEQLYVPPKLLAHPVVQNMPYFAFKVSCSIQPVSSTCEPIILSRGLKAQDIYYPSGNFYPPVKDHTYVPFGAFVQMVGVKSGKGRVMGFTDSTSYSNFEAFIEGKPELMLGSLAWLNQENQWDTLNTLFFVLFSVCLAFGIQILRTEKLSNSTSHFPLPTSHFSLLLLILGVFLISSALFVCQFLSQKAYPIPKPVTPYTKVVFEQEHGDYELPLRGFTKEHSRSYEVFYLWVLRTENYPFTGKTLKQDLSSGETDVLVIINPNKTFQPDEVALVKAYLDKGGKILLMDGKGNQASTANELLAPLDMKMDPEPNATLPAPYRSTYRQPGRDDALVVDGGTPLLYSQEGLPILSSARVGEGMITVAGFSQLFANPNMGGSYRVKPDKRLRAIYDLEFSLIRGLVKPDGSKSEESLPN